MGTQRLSGNEPRILFLWMLGLLITFGILSLQIAMQTGVFQPVRISIFARLFMFSDYTASFAFIAVLLLAPFPPIQRTAAALARTMGENPKLTSFLATLALAAGAWWVYQAHPLSMDEAAPYMQSKIFAAGALAGKFPPDLLDWLIHRPFLNYFIRASAQTGEIASSYWPGFALLLTPFMATGVPWLCNPVLGGLSVWVIHRLTLQLTRSVEAAGAAVLFALASAAFVVNSISFYSMTAHLLCNATFALLLLKPTPGRTLAAGFIGGLALTLHNPVPHILFAAPWLLWLLWQRNRWQLLLSAAAGYLPWIGVAGFGWHYFIQGLTDGTAQSGAGGQAAKAATMFASAFRLPGTEELWNRAIALAKLWLWAAPLIILLAGAGFWRHRRDIRVRLLLASAVLTFVGYLFVPLDQGHGWGFRYFHSVWFVLPVLAAAALAPAANPAGTSTASQPHPLGRWAQATALGGLLILTPCFAWQVHTFIDSHLAQLPAADRGEPRVVIVNRAAGYYAEDLVQNDPFLRDPVIRFISRGQKADAAMMARHFPGLALLSHSYRGSVWGYPSTGLAVGPQEHRQQK